jgi:hypothetical protein
MLDPMLLAAAVLAVAEWCVWCSPRTSACRRHCSSPSAKSQRCVMLLAAAVLVVAEWCVWCFPTHKRVPQTLCLTFCKINKVREQRCCLH